MSEPGNQDSHDVDARAVSRAYRHAPSAEPPLALDDAIRAAARRAAGSRPQSLGRSWLRRWTGPVSIAAVLVLTVSIVLLSLDENPEMGPQPMRQLVRPSPVPEKEIPQAAGDTPSAAMPAEKVESAPPATTAEKLADKPAPATANDQSRGQLEKKRDAVTAVPAPHEPVPFAAERQRDSDIKTQAPPSADAIDQEQLAAKRAPAAAPPSAPAVSDLQKFEMERKLNARQAAPGSVESPALMRPKAATAQANQMEAPEVWLKRIVEMHRDGKLREVREELEKFKRQYPDYPLPAELGTNP